MQEALPRAAGHGAQIRTMPGTCQLATALTCKSEAKHFRLPSPEMALTGLQKSSDRKPRDEFPR